MDTVGCESALAIRIEMLSKVGGGVPLRSFAIWCAMQCQLTTLQARFVGDCARTLRRPIAEHASRFANLRDQCRQQVAGALLIGMKHDPAGATACIAVASISHPDPMEAAVLAARHARSHAAFRTKLVDDTVTSASHPSVGEEGRASQRLVGLWAAALAFGDQIDQIDRLITESESA